MLVVGLPRTSNKMVEVAQRELQTSVEALVDRFSNGSLAVQKKGVECSLRCFQDGHDFKKVGRCIQECQKPFEELSQVFFVGHSLMMRVVYELRVSCWREVFI